MKAADLRVVFLGTPAFALPSLHRLHESGIPISLVVTQPDRPAGRGQALHHTPVYQAAVKRGLQVATPGRLTKEPDVRKTLGEATVGIVVAYGKLIPTSWLTLPARGFLNVHPSLLPRYRGASPIQATILNNDRQTGVTLMRLDAGLDTGPIIAQHQFPLSGTETAATLSLQLAELSAALLQANLLPYCQGVLPLIPQDNRRATVTRPLSAADGRIDWRENAEVIERKLRAYNPWPGCWTTFRGQRLKLWRGQVVDGEGQPGKVAPAPPWRVFCGQRSLELTEVQFAGRKVISAEEALRGYQLLGSQL